MGLHKISVALGSAIKAEPDLWAPHEHNVRGTSQAPVRLLGCLPVASWG